MTAWIPGRNNVVIINKYTIIKASPKNFGLEDNKNMIPSHIPDFINLPSCSQEGAQWKSIRPQEGPAEINYVSIEFITAQNQKLCSDEAFPSFLKTVKIPTLPNSQRHPA